MACTLLVWAACGAATLPLPSKGGPAWRELTSEHFTLWTDAEPARAHALIRELDRLSQVITAVAFPSAPANARGLVIALRDFDELRMFVTGAGVGGYAAPPVRPFWQPMIVMPAYAVYADETVVHEVTHLISRMVIHRQPRWLAEGMAKYFETLQFNLDESAVRVGLPMRDGAKLLRLPTPAPVARMFAWEPERRGEGSLYVTAWAVFSFLINEHPRDLVRYLEVLAAFEDAPGELPGDRLARAWDAAFPSLPAQKLDAVVRDWLLRGKHTVKEFAVQWTEGPIAQRTLDDADVLAIRGLMFVLDERGREAEASFMAALEADPGNVLARLVVTQVEHTALSVPAARAMVAAHPDDWRAWWLAFGALSAAPGTESEATAAAGKACALIAQNPALVAPPKLCPVR